MVHCTFMCVTLCSFLACSLSLLSHLCLLCLCPLLSLLEYSMFSGHGAYALSLHPQLHTGSHCWSVFMCLCIGLFMCAYVHYMVACSCVLVFLCVVVPFAYVYVCVCRGVRGPPPRQALGPGIRKEPEPTVTVQGPISLLVLPPRFLFFRNLFPFCPMQQITARILDALDFMRVCGIKELEVRTFLVVFLPLSTPFDLPPFVHYG